jgi:hypothetical protein
VPPVSALMVKRISSAFGIGQLGNRVVAESMGPLPYPAPWTERPLMFSLTLAMGIYGGAGNHMQVFELESFGGSQHTFGDNHFQVFIHHMFFLVGHFFEFGKHNLQFFIGQIISHLFEMVAQGVSSGMLAHTSLLWLSPMVSVS